MPDNPPRGGRPPAPRRTGERAPSSSKPQYGPPGSQSGSQIGIQSGSQIGAQSGLPQV